LGSRRLQAASQSKPPLTFRISASGDVSISNILYETPNDGSEERKELRNKFSAC
jgi:hypothetical protein